MYENPLDPATGADVPGGLFHVNLLPFCGVTILLMPFCLALVYDWAENTNFRQYISDPATSWVTLVWTSLVIAAMRTNYRRVLLIHDRYLML